MTAIAHPDRLLLVDEATKEIHISQDYILGRVFTPFAFPGRKTVSRLTGAGESVWGRSIFQYPFPGGAGTYPKGLALSLNGKWLYAVGRYQVTTGYYSLIKLNAMTGETVWTREFTMWSYHLVVDHSDDIIIWGRTNGEPQVDKLMKFDADGNNLWTQEYEDVTGIAVDSLNNIYIGHSPKVDGFGVQMLNPSGVAQKGGAVGGQGNVYGITITPNDELFTVGTPVEDSPSVWHRIFKWEEGEAVLTMSDSTILGVANSGISPQAIYSDHIGNIIATDDTWVHSYTSGLVTNWSADTSDTDNAVAIDVQNRVHVIGADYSGQHGGILIYDKAGNIDGYIPPTATYSENNPAIMAREVWVGEYTDQSYAHYVEDTCCFLDDEIDGPWDDVDIPPEGHAEGEIWFRDEVHSNWEQFTGIFESLQDANFTEPGVNDEGWFRLGNWNTRLGRVPPCGNEDWDTFPGIAGGVGGGPKIYTVAVKDMLNVSDDQPSPHNGEYLIIRGPGKFGFFFGVRHDAGTRMNFTIADSLELGSETFEFGTDADPSSIFSYTDDAAHGGKWIDIVSTNEVGTGGAVAYGGTASIYPGKIDRWDAITIWAADSMCAWQGSFYTANNDNQNSEPPSGDWTVVS